MNAREQNGSLSFILFIPACLLIFPASFRSHGSRKFGIGAKICDFKCQLSFEKCSNSDLTPEQLCVSFLKCNHTAKTDVVHRCVFFLMARYKSANTVFKTFFFLTDTPGKTSKTFFLPSLAYLKTATENWVTTLFLIRYINQGSAVKVSSTSYEIPCAF